MNKKIIIGLFLLLLVFFGVILYIILQVPAPRDFAVEKTEVKIEEGNTVDLPVWAEKDKKLRFTTYRGTAIAELDEKNELKLLSKQIFDIENHITWNSLADKVLVYGSYYSAYFKGSSFENNSLAEGEKYNWLYDFKNDKVEQIISNKPQLQFIKDGFVFAKQDGVYRLATNGQGEEKIVNLEKGDTFFLQPAPNGLKLLAYQNGFDGLGVIYEIDILQKKIQKVININGYHPIWSPDSSSFVYIDKSLTNQTTLTHYKKGQSTALAFMDGDIKFAWISDKNITYKFLGSLFVVNVGNKKIDNVKFSGNMDYIVSAGENRIFIASDGVFSFIKIIGL